MRTQTENQSVLPNRRAIKTFFAILSGSYPFSYPVSVSHIVFRRLPLPFLRSFFSSLSLEIDSFVACVSVFFFFFFYRRYSELPAASLIVFFSVIGNLSFSCLAFLNFRFFIHVIPFSIFASFNAVIGKVLMRSHRVTSHLRDFLVNYNIGKKLFPRLDFPSFNEQIWIIKIKIE